MKVLALIGSPRKGSNTDILVDQVLCAARARGNTSRKIYLYDHHISPCLDCRRCKKNDYVCALVDGMLEIYPKLEEADLIIFGTPIYWYGPTAQMKLLIDRLRPFISSGSLRGKMGVLVTPSEEGESCCGPITDMFRMSLNYLGMKFGGCILAKAYERGEILGDEQALDRAYEFGACL
jgi:multimeric flavodoxin WrbA